MVGESNISGTPLKGNIILGEVATRGVLTTILDESSLWPLLPTSKAVIEYIDTIKNSLAPTIATKTVPGVILSSEEENSVRVLESGVLVLNTVNVNKLVQTDDEYLVLKCVNKE